MPWLDLWRDGLVVARSGTMRPGPSSVLLATVLLGCGDDASPPAPIGETTPASGQAASASGGTATDGIGSTGELDCDPLGDPAVECGATQECSFADQRCYAATGTATEGQPCEVTDPARLLDTCAPALVCGQVDSDAPRCLAPCDTDLPCADTTSCIAAPDPVPGLCLSQCDGLAPQCPSAGDSCYPIIDFDGVFTAVCLPAGAAVPEDPCVIPNDCVAGATCTAAELHATACGGQDACCAATCDAFAGNCAGLDSQCSDLGIPSSPNLGICTAPG